MRRSGRRCGGVGRWEVKSSGASRWRRWGSLNEGSRYGEELKESDEARARRIVEEEIRGLKFPDLNKLMKGAEKKVKIAAGLRAKPAVPLKSVAQELGWEASRMCPSVCRSGRRSEKPWD